MIEHLRHIDFPAVAAALALSFVLGGVWFGVVVTKLYTKALGRENLPAQKPSSLFIVGPLICNVFVVIASAFMIRLLQLTSIREALSFGLLVSIGYVLPTMMNIAINPNFPRLFLYALINTPYFLASNLITSIVLVALQS